MRTGGLTLQIPRRETKAQRLELLKLKVESGGIKREEVSQTRAKLITHKKLRHSHTQI